MPRAYKWVFIVLGVKSFLKVDKWYKKGKEKNREVPVLPTSWIIIVGWEM